jgi:hypothetical protein
VDHIDADPVVFLISVRTIKQRSGARLLVDSIRSFGGALSDRPIWLFEVNPQETPCDDLEEPGVHLFPLSVPEKVRHYWFADKVCACARAEELADPGNQSLVWLSCDSLIIQPPLLFHLAQMYDAAVRPVHIRNVGLLASAEVDDYWNKVYEAVGVPDIESTVESFVDAQRIRSYYNSHALAVDPSKGLFRRWYECFELLVCDGEFQSGPCQDDRHRIFLHQAVLSALIASSLKAERICHLPPEYTYPYNLQGRVPSGRRARVLNDLVSIAYEDRPLNPAAVQDIEIHEPLRSWLSTRTKQTGF